MRIPKVFHCFWDGPEKPDYVKRAMASWQPLHPDWTVKVWTLDSLPLLRNQDLIDEWERVSPKSNRWQFVTDLARLEILYDEGGVWIDADLEALRNVEPLIDDCDAFTSRESRQYVNNGFTGCVAGHPWYGDMLEQARNRVLRMRDKRSNWSVGPHLFTDTIRRHPSVRIHPTEKIYPIGWQHVDTPGDLPTADDMRARHPDAYTWHMWHNKLSGGKRG